MSNVTLPEAIKKMVKDVNWPEAIRAANLCDEIRERFGDSPRITTGLCYLAGVIEGKRIERAKRRHISDREEGNHAD